MYSLGYNNNLSHCSLWGRTRQDIQPNGYYPPINQPLNGLGTSNPIYQLESMVSQNSPLSLVSARPAQRNYPSCNRYMYNSSAYQDVSQRRDWQWRRYNDEALGELCSWLQATESTLSSRLPPRAAETRSSCAVFRPAPKEKRKPSTDDEKSPKKQTPTGKKTEKGKRFQFYNYFLTSATCILVDGIARDVLHLTIDNSEAHDSLLRFSAVLFEN